MSVEHGLTALSPLDGRYRSKLAGLADAFSEQALIRQRLRVEVEWFIALAQHPGIADLPPLDDAQQDALRLVHEKLTPADAVGVKEIEARIGHDVKSVEYLLKERLDEMGLGAHREFVHFACTSEDINNIAYALMLQEGVQEHWTPAAHRLRDAVAALARDTRAVAMVSHTHGQTAVPTTFGKELAVFVARWDRQLDRIEGHEYRGKLNGATGTFSAHVAAYPEVDWVALSRAFVERFGLTWNPLTTQIEPHDHIAELFHALARFNTVLVDFAADMWAYVSMGYLRQRLVDGEVGSSTMPHKINPIHFENAEANASLSTALLQHLAVKLPVSRLQRDLTDSSTIRNNGTAVGHGLLALLSAADGFRRVAVDQVVVDADLDQAWEVLGEAVQTVLRKHGADDPYAAMKKATRGQQTTAESIRAAIAAVDLPDDDRRRLEALTPATYVGLADRLVDELGPDRGAAPEGAAG